MFYVLIDEEGRVYIAITSKAYPSRYVYSTSDGSSRGVLGALKREILEKFPDASLTCGPNGLDGKVKPLLKALCDEFNDIKGIDKIASVQQKVDAVTGVMQKNIELALKNTDRLEDIDEKAVQLSESALKFKNAGTALKRKMACRLWKTCVARARAARACARRHASARAPRSFARTRAVLTALPAPHSLCCTPAAQVPLFRAARRDHHRLDRGLLVSCARCACTAPRARLRAGQPAHARSPRIRLRRPPRPVRSVDQNNKNKNK
jgi:hypothetical protein